jgi:hypothetical protein
MADRIVVQMQHANSAVVLTAIKVLLYLMNYMEDRKIMDYVCKKMGPPLGEITLILSCFTNIFRLQSHYSPLDPRFNTWLCAIFS